MMENNKKNILSFDMNFDDIGFHGEIKTPFSVKDLNDIGIEYKDTAKVTFLDKEIILPLVPIFRYTHAGGNVIMGKGDMKAVIMSFHSNFVRNNKIAVFLEEDNGEINIFPCKNIKFPIKVTIELFEKGGYNKGFETYNLLRSNNRDDYLHLTDEEFCNFRQIIVGLMRPNLLYRSSTPINNILGRAKYADKCLEKYKIKTIINLCDSEESAKSFEGFNDTYYSKQNVLYLNANADVVSYNFGKSVIKAIRYINEHEGPYLIHCIEGQDRTGAVCAIFESIFYASKNELIEDFMKTYENFYGIEKGTDRYMTILRGVLQKDIISVRGFSYDTIDILKNPESYLMFLDLGHQELEKFSRKFMKKY